MDWEKILSCLIGGTLFSAGCVFMGYMFLDALTKSGM